ILRTAQGFPTGHIGQVAIAPSLATILFTSASRRRARARRGAVRRDIARPLAPGLMGGTRAGAQLAAALGGRVLPGGFGVLVAPGIMVGSVAGAQIAAALRGSVLAIGFGVFVALMATQMLFKRASVADRTLPGSAARFGMGGVIGLMSAIVGAGGAFITVPFLTRANVKIHQAVATSAACGFPIALAGTLGYVYAGWGLQLPAGTAGYIYVPALASIVATSVLTAPLGARVAHAMDVGRLRTLFALLLYALAAYMLWKGLYGH